MPNSPIGDGASLTVISLQDWDDDAVHVATHAALVGRDATLPQRRS